MTAGYIHWKVTQRSTKDQMVWPALVPSDVEPAELSQIAENRKIFRDFQGFLSPPHSPEEKVDMKMNE